MAKSYFVVLRIFLNPLTLCDSLWNLCESLCYSCCTERHQEDIEIHKEKTISIDYKGVKLDQCNRIDLLIEEKVVVEIKTVEAFSDVHTTVFKNGIK